MERKYTLGLYEKAMPGGLTWREKMTAAGQADFDFIEISIDESEEKLARLDMYPEQRLELLCLMQETGIPIRTMCLSGHRRYPLGSSDPGVAKKGLEIMGKAVKLAEDLGIRIIQLAGYDVYYEHGTSDTRRRFEKNLHEAVEMASCAGVILGFENMETNFMNTVQKAMNYVKRSQSPYLNVYPDLGNITNAAGGCCAGVLSDLETGRGHLAAIHLKETLPGQFRDVPFGMGHVDFESDIQMAWQLGVRRYVAECWHNGDGMWRKELRRISLMMRGILDRQGIQEDFRGSGS